MTRLSQGARDDIPGLQLRLTLASGAVGIAFLLLLIHLMSMQVFRHERYQKLADHNRIRLVEMTATRGIVRDRNGVILADSVPSYHLGAVLEDMPREREDELRALALHLGRPAEEAVERFRADPRKVPFRAIPVLLDLAPGEVARFEADKEQFPGISVQVAPRRFYPFGKTAAHLLGYAGEISPEQLASGRFPGARVGDAVGQGGIESWYDTRLRGKNGGRQVEVDAQGHEIGLLGVQEPVAGANLTLSIDIRVQQALEDALGPRGAGVVLDARTGEVLALASHPAFDPNEFAVGISRARWRELADDPEHPLQNRALSGLFPPGSAFKAVTAIAGLMEGTLDPGANLACSGGYSFGDRVYRCWQAKGHGRVSLHRAIVESCDVYFYQQGERAGIEGLYRWGSALGLGRKTGIDLPGEVAGLMPSPAWKRTARKEPWYPGETLSAAIGQGSVLVTPLQLALLYQELGNRGRRMVPRVVSRIEGPEGELRWRSEPVPLDAAPVSGTAWSLVDLALLGVTEEKGGTGWGARLKGVRVAGKTGTAQVAALAPDAPRRQLADTALEARDHAWFAAFAPFEAPELAGAVVVEHGGHGGTAAAPVVGKAFAAWWGTGAVVAAPAGSGEEGD